MVELSPNALQLLDSRYLLKNEVAETPEGLFQRVARHASEIEENCRDLWFERFFALLGNLEFLPNSPTLMNAGLPDGQLSACFVLPVEDDLEGIFSTLKNAALIHHSGGGTGYNFSRLRPRGDRILSTGGQAAGPLAFMKVFDAATESVKQAGKRSGANMGILNIDHPDVEAFISSKSDRKSLQNFNISVGITDDFMEAVEIGDDWPLINPRTKKIWKTVKAGSLWRSIVGNAHKSGDPGLIFLDTINRLNPLPDQGRIQSTNPCGEVPLLEYESCNLGSVNLARMLHAEGGKLQIDWSKLEVTVVIAIRFLDNIISANHYPLPEIRDKTLSNRKIGLGVMGWAELLILLGIPYASDAAVCLAEKLMKFIRDTSYAASAKLARERKAFPTWIKSNLAPNRPMRNATCNSIAPTGSISVIAGTSYSIEPLYALAFKRVGVLDGTIQNETNRIFVERMKKLKLWTTGVRDEVLASGSIRHIPGIPEGVKNLFATSLDIPWKYHMLHQQAFQKFTDNAVSKTINLPGETTEKEISDIYTASWKNGLKGITVYRDASKPEQVLQHCGLGPEGPC